MPSALAQIRPQRDVDRLGRDRRDEAAELLAVAFRDNPLNRAVIGEPADRRLRCNRVGSRASLGVALGRAHCAAVREGTVLVGVLVGEPPEALPLPPPPWAAQLRSLLGQGWRVARRWGRVHFELHRLRPAERHWYLDLLAVAPEAQGRGHGWALMCDFLRRVDADRAPSYLETDRPENVRFYERAGYGTLAEERLLGVRVWRMWRPPAEGGSDVR